MVEILRASLRPPHQARSNMMNFAARDSSTWRNWHLPADAFADRQGQGRGLGKLAVLLVIPRHEHVFEPHGLVGFQGLADPPAGPD